MLQLSNLFIKFQKRTQSQSRFFPNRVKARGVFQSSTGPCCFGSSISMSSERFHSNGLYKPTCLQRTIKCHAIWLFTSHALRSCSKELDSHGVDSLLDHTVMTVIIAGVSNSGGLEAHWRPSRLVMRTKLARTA